MKLIDFLKKRGQQSWLAKKIGVTDSCLCDWKKGRFSIPEKRAVAIEHATNGAVTRKDLRPHDWWDIWPELAEKGE